MEPLEEIVKRIREKWKNQRKLKVERWDLENGYFRYLVIDEEDNGRAVCCFEEDDYPKGERRWEAKKNAEKFAGAAENIKDLFSWIKCLENEIAELKKGWYLIRGQGEINE